MTLNLSNRENLNILQWNARSAVANKKSLEKVLFEHNIQIALISETWFKPGKFINFSGYNIIREDREDGKAGVAIFLKANIFYREIHSYFKIPNLQSCAVSVTYDEKPINIISFYNPPTNNITSQEWTEFFDSFHGSKIIGGDSNCHHQAWGCSQSDTKGRSLLDAMDDANIFLLNTGEPTLMRNINHRHVSAIDLTMVSVDLSGLLEWNVMDDTMGSNHFAIKISSEAISVKSIFKNQIRKWKINQANWGKFQTEMKKLTEQSYQKEHINNHSYEFFIRNLNHASEHSIPKVKQFNANSTFRKPWWNEECEKLLKDRKLKLNIYKSSLSLEDFLEYTKSDSNFKKFCKKSSRKAWQTFCSSLNRHVKISEVWQSIKRLKNKKIAPSIPLQEGKWSDDLFSSLCPPYVMQEKFVSPLSQEDENNEMNKNFSLEELNKSIKSNSNTAPGMDNVHYPMLQNLPTVAREHLLDIFNNIWESGKIPEEWKNIIVVPFLKPKKPPDNYKSFRPISLASCVLKTFERMVKNRLDWWLESNNLLPITQYGFRKSKSVVEAQASLLLDIEQGFAEQKSTLAIFYDVEGAYNGIQVPILMEKLYKIKCPYKITQIIYAIISQRYLYLRINNKLIGPKTACLGLGQGDILSCPLYSIYTMDLETSIPPEIKIVQFVDDFCIYLTDKSPEICEIKIKSGILAVEKFMSKNGLKISYPKSEAVLFSRKRRPNISQNISVNHYEIPINKKVRFLGLMMEQKLNWSNHIEHVVNKTCKYINIMKSICNKHWGMDPHIALTFYRATIRATLDFGSIFYVHSARSKLNKVHVTQSKALRIAMGYLNSTPIDVILQETREKSITDRAYILIDRFILKSMSIQSQTLQKINDFTIMHLTSKKLKNRPSPPLIESYCNLSKYNSKIYTSDKPPQYLFDYEVLLTQVDRGYVSHYEAAPDHSKQSFFLNEIKEKWPESHLIFTDGSKISESVGSAFYDVQNQNSGTFKLHSSATIFTAEAFAVLQALKYVQSLDINEIIILSDSQSCLDKLLNVTTSNKNINHLILDILSEYSLLQKKHKAVKFIWIRGHASITGNEMVDKLAKEAALNPDIPVHPYPVPFQDVRAVTDMEHELKWRQMISSKQNNKGLFYKNLFTIRNRKTWFSKAISCRKFIVTFNRLRSNHALCKSYLHKINIAPSSFCEECNEREDFEHIFLCCTKYQNERKVLFRKIDKILDHPFNYSTMISNPLCYSHLYKYLNQRKIQT